MQAEPPLTRRRTRGHENDDDDTIKLDDELEDEIAEEDEITRCLCGMQEYPGPPSDAGKSKDGQLSALGDSDVPGEDAGGLFIQCDICKVWQHGGCVGIMDEASSPDEYFCEECRKDLHKVMISSKGCVISSFVISAVQTPSARWETRLVPAHQKGGGWPRNLRDRSISTSPINSTMLMCASV